MKKKKIIIYIIISIVIEFLLSNINYLNLLFCDGKKNEVVDFIASVEKYDQVKQTIVQIDTKKTQIQNIKIYYHNKHKKNPQVITYTPEIKVVGLANHKRQLQSKYAIENKNTKINIYAENVCLKLTLYIDHFEDIHSIEKIVINDMHIGFSFLRFLIIWLIFLFVYFLKNVNKEIEYDPSNKKQSIILKGIIIFLLIISAIWINLTIQNINFVDKEIDYSWNFLNAQIESILQNRADILLKPSDELLGMENPLDNTVRRTMNPQAVVYTDYSLYNGSFYSYFGLAPLLIMLPFRIITGYYLSNIVTCFIFFTIMIISLAKLYQMLIHRYVKHVSYFNYVLGFITILFSAITFFQIRGMVYDIEDICACLFTILSYIFILSIYEHPKEKVYRKIVVISICMGCMILSKPSFIAYYFLLFYLLFHLRSIISKKDFKRAILIFVIPIGIIAIFQMWWNQIRFGSIFCFGSKYQMTTFDMENLTYLSPIKLIKGLIKYLFALPLFNFSKFPFVFIRELEWTNFDFNTIMYDTPNIGIFAIPISWIYLLYRSISKNYQFSKELSKTITFLLISVLLILLITIRNGVSENYITDVKLFMYMFAVIFYFKMLEKRNNPLLQRFFWIICFTSILITLPINIRIGTPDYLELIDTNIELYLKNIFEFWT